MEGGRDGCREKKAWKCVHVSWKQTVDAALIVKICLNKELVFFFHSVQCFLVPFLVLSAGNIHPSVISRSDIKNYSGLKLF